MVAFTAVLTVFATLAATFTQISANPSEAIHELLARQSAFDPSMIPEQCRNQCSSLATTLTAGNCLDVDCLCGSNISSAMSSCLACAASALDTQTAQSYYDSYANACKAAGKNVPSFSAASGSSGNGASRVHMATAGFAGALGVGFLLAA